MKSKRIGPEKLLSTANKIERSSCLKSTSHQFKQNKLYATSDNIRTLNDRQNEQTLKTTLKQSNRKISSRKTQSKKQKETQKNCLSEPKLNKECSNIVFQSRNQTAKSKQITKKRSVTSLYNKKDKENAQVFFQKNKKFQKEQNRNLQREQNRNTLRDQNRNTLREQNRGTLKKPDITPKGKTLIVSPQAFHETNFDLMSKTKNLQTISPSKLVSRKLFAKDTNQESLIQNQIGFNINLNTILKKLDIIIEKEKFKTKKRSSDLKKQSVLSQQNLQLLRKLTKKLTLAQSDMPVSNQKKYIETAHENFVYDQTPSKEVFDDIQLKRNHDSISVDKSERIKMNNKQLKEEQIEKTVKKLQEQHEEHSRHLKRRIKQIKQDNVWLIDNLQKLLQQNEQLKLIMGGKK